MFRKVFPHAAIIISLMYLIFFGIDRVNSAMNFINNDMTKWLLVALALISIANAVTVIAFDRREAERRWREQQKKRKRAKR